MNIDESRSARLGKIARLPLDIRQQLNERLADNEPGRRLVRWLNAQPAVQRVLADLFDGRPISTQNLSAWKLGGFRDWERRQEVRARAREYIEEADALGKEVSEPDEGEGGSFLDRVGDRMALALMELFREAEISAKGPERTREMLEIAGELARLRRSDHQRQYAAVAQERWRDEQWAAELKSIQEESGKKFLRDASLSLDARSVRGEFLLGLATGTLDPDREKAIRKFFTDLEGQLRELNIPGLPEGEELAVEVEAMKERLQRKAAQDAVAAEEAEINEDLEDEDLEEEVEDAGQSRPGKAAQAKSR